MPTFKRHTFPHNDDPTKQYFSQCNPDKWDFTDFILSFPTSDRRQKEDHVRTLLRKYLDALQWIQQHNVSVPLRNHVKNLRKRWKKLSSGQVKDLVMRSTSPGNISIHADNIVAGDDSSIVIGVGNTSMALNVSKKREQEVEEEQDENDTVSSNSPGVVADDDDEEQEDVEVLTLWDGWIEFLNQSEDSQAFDQFTPEASGVILCGDGVHKRESIPNNLYQGVQAVTKKRSKREKAHHGIEGIIGKVLDASTIQELEEEVASIPVKEATPGSKNKLLFVKDVFCTIAGNVYSGVVDPSHSENSWNQAILWPVMMACARYIRREDQGNVVFAPGEEELYAMTTAGPAESGAPYYADGVMRMTEKSNIEICLLETSRAQTKASNSKVSFDHHKGMFALLSMLKRVATTYHMATYEQLSDLEIVFLHAHGDAIRVWTMSTPQQGVYVMNKKLKIAMPTSFSSKDDEMLSFLQSCWDLLHLLVDAVDALKRLENSHRAKKRQFVFNDEDPPIEDLLSTLVNPKIVKITEKRNTKDTAGDGPRSSPFASQNSGHTSDSD